ncbi:hypothetical protein SAMN05444920_102181 [Nonomuraea solani]|uniref:Uncharacterized protein n=1 Tax=Nonomuraea solani TaxID=1144553 RepID=A0A1H5Y8L1_9ACTN|nr:hypothetical protein [Nonomuraea solani]SEG20304.1 hypothetical protein SAMN05444920_102181 [Nonomuraea solani]
MPETQRGRAFALLLTGTMTRQGLAAAAGGALGEIAALGPAVTPAGAASTIAALMPWPTLSPTRRP